MTDQIFRKLSDFIQGSYGIKMPDEKKTMLSARLQKRLKANNMTSFDEYCDYIFSAYGMKNEVTQMINVVSTNKTDFFREPAHFVFLKENLSKFIQNCNGRPLRIWSAAASTGEEAYSIAITCEEFMREEGFFEYSIHCTDISTSVLETAKLGIYKSERASQIPLSIKHKYFLRNKNSEQDTLRVIPKIRKRMTFGRLNFMDQVYHVPHEFDIIFCRNVLIYFERNVQQNVVGKLCQTLRNDGCFLLGHSESITGMDVPLNIIKPTIYKKHVAYEAQKIC